MTSRLVVCDLSNLARDRRIRNSQAEADLDATMLFEDALQDFDESDHDVLYVADRNLRHLVPTSQRARFAALERSGQLEVRAVADERILDLAFGWDASASTLVASMDCFDDFRRSFPALQGCTDRVVGWRPGSPSGIELCFRNMGVRDHHQMSRREESALFKERRIVRREIVERAVGRRYGCGDESSCLLAQVWKGGLPYPPRYVEHEDSFVCPGCGGPVDDLGERPSGDQVIVFLNGAEMVRIFVEEGTSLELGRSDGPARVGLGPRLPGAAADAVSRRHLVIESSNGRLVVADCGSSNGTLFRDASGSERQLGTVPVELVGRSVVALPGGITIERSGRRNPFGGIEGDANRVDEADGSATRVLTSW
jgi:hypothetical protein